MRHLILAAQIKNPIDGIVPDFSFGGQQFTELWQKLIAAIWAIAIIVAIVYLIRGLVAMAGASGDLNPNPQAHAQGKAKALAAFISLVGLAALAVIVGVTLSLAGCGGPLMPRMYSATGRSRWPLLVVGLVAVVGLGGGVAFTLTHHNAPAATVLSPTPPDVSPSSSAAADTGVGDDEDGASPTGCLGGLDRNAAMVVTAQKEAAHTPYGAVEVATAFYRFVWQSPVPATADIQSVIDDVISPVASASYRDLFGVYRAHPNVSHGDVADSLPFHLSTTNGIWMVDPDSTSDQVTVDIAAGYVVDGALSPSESTFQGFVMR